MGLEEGANWLARNRDARNYLFYGANLVINPIRGAMGLAGKFYQGAFSEHYARNAHIANLARLGLAVVTALDTLNFDGVVDTFGDVILTFALLTDTSYAKERSLAGIGEDIKRLNLRGKVKSLSDKIDKDK